MAPACDDDELSIDRKNGGFFYMSGQNEHDELFLDWNDGRID
jgi:hypothetical protein